MQRTLDSAGRVSLRALLPEARFFGGQDVRFASCVTDARRCRPGDLYAALVSAERDGHDQAAEAVSRGAAAVLGERLLPLNVPVCVVPHSSEAYGRICHRLAGNPGDLLHVTGVTGTHGKTVTSLLIAGVLHAARRRVGVTSTIGYSDSVDMAAAAQTTPVPPELAKWLARMAGHGCSHGVVEVSSRGLAERRLAGLQLDAAVLTNLRRDHIEHHGSVLNYRRAKTRIFEYLKPGGFAVVNLDDPGSRLALSVLNCPVITTGMREEAEVMAEVVERHPSEQTFLLTAGSDTVPVRTRMIGDHHVANCLSAAAVGLVLGLDVTQIARGLESVERVPGRLERIECGQPFGVFIDCADNADRLAVCLNSLRRAARGRLYCVLGCDSRQAPEELAILGRVVERGADLAVLTDGCEPTAQPLQRVHDVLDGYDRPARAHVIPSRDQAIRWALQQAQPGDNVLIAGSPRTCGLENVKQRPVCDDEQVARTWLRQMAGAPAGVPGKV